MITAKIPECKFVGKTYKAAGTTFIAPTGIYCSAFEDYTVLSDFDCSALLATSRFPVSLKQALHPKWQYSMHVSHAMLPSVNRNLLYARVIGGEILGYKYMECSIEGNEAIYYGFIPTQSKHADLKTTHKKCRFAMQEVFPRRMYVYLEKFSDKCDCSEPSCLKLKARIANGAQKGQFCASAIPWTKIYIMLGELNDNCAEQIKIPRECRVCAQCYNCSKSVQYCRKHRTCKHKPIAKDRTAATSSKYKIPQIRDCKSLKNKYD